MLVDSEEDNAVLVTHLIEVAAVWVHYKVIPNAGLCRPAGAW